MRIGVIDLGTNTFNILIAELVEGEGVKHLLNTKSAVMLGSGGLSDGYISEKIFNRAFGVLSDFREMLDEFKCENVTAFGTSAIRSARNSDDFINKVKNELNINIEPISGDQEAEFIYHGVKQAVTFTNENYLILDIGGGSNEFIIANEKELLWKHSFALGGARLLERFKPSDPIEDIEIREINHYLNSELELLKEALNKYPIIKLVGSSGAFDSFASIIYYKKNKSTLSKSVESSVLSLADFNDLYDEIIESSRTERLMLPGLEPIRVDTIVMASVFTKMALSISGANEIIQSSFSLKEGVVALQSK